jgi:tetratricopeptide (TPR) repeat protein
MHDIRWNFEHTGWAMNTDEAAYRLCRVYFAANRPQDLLLVLRNYPCQSGKDVGELLVIPKALGTTFNVDPLALPFGYYIGWALSKKGNKDLAVRVLERLLIEAPTVDEAWQLLGSLSVQRSLALSEVLHRLFPTETRPLIWKAECLRRLNRTNQALALISEAIQMDPSDSVSGSEYRFLALKVLKGIELQLGNISAANRCERQIDAGKVAAKAYLFKKNGFLPQAIDLFVQSLKLSPTDYVAEERLSQCLEGKGRFADARRHRQEAYRLLPKCFGRTTDMNWDFDDLLESPEKIEVGLPILMATPPTAASCYLIGRCLSALGDQPKAIRMLKKSVGLDPKFVLAWDLLIELGHQGYIDKKLTETAAYKVVDLDPMSRRQNFYLLASVSDLRPVYRRYAAFLKHSPRNEAPLMPVNHIPGPYPQILPDWRINPDRPGFPPGALLLNDFELREIASRYREDQL